jgi:hypothetical protein
MYVCKTYLIENNSEWTGQKQPDTWQLSLKTPALWVNLEKQTLTQTQTMTHLFLLRWQAAIRYHCLHCRRYYRLGYLPLH